MPTSFAVPSFETSPSNARIILSGMDFGYPGNLIPRFFGGKGSPRIFWVQGAGGVGVAIWSTPATQAMVSWGPWPFPPTSRMFLTTRMPRWVVSVVSDIPRMSPTEGI